tara:strand:+ start:608 stop:1129 length:522 start_codon:yes stop_codon:yes gene_type:complete
MVDETIVALSLTGGVAVLMGYYFVAMTGVGSKLYRIFTSNEKTIFLTLSTLSIISFFYLFYWASFTDSLKDWKRDVYIASVATYLAGASLWSIMAYRIVKMKLHPSSQTLALFITALGAIGLTVAVGSVSEKDGLKYGFAMIAAILFLIQHAFFDLIYWSKIHSQRYNKRLYT